MKLNKILLSASLLFPLATLPTIVSCSEKEEGTIEGAEPTQYNVDSQNPIASISFHWTGQKEKKINYSIEYTGSKTISPVTEVNIDEDGDFCAKVRYIGLMPKEQYSQQFNIKFTYELNEKQTTQTFSGYTLSYSYTGGADPIKGSAEDFIFNRTISLLGMGQNIKEPEYASLCRGTAWILSDATKDNFTDYEYYVATNWHVKYGIDQIKDLVFSSTFQVCYGSDKNPLDAFENYTRLVQYTPISPESTFTYNGSKSNAIDFYIAKISFGSKPSSSVKSHLDAINKMQKQVGYTTKTAKTTSSVKFNDLTTYMGGYPVRSDKSTWGFETIPANYLNYFGKSSIPHSIDDYKKIIDVSPNYIVSDYYVDPDWMPGGASGSMLIADIENEWQVIAIYWGGFEDESKTMFFPAFSIFNSNYKDFTQGY